MRKTMMTIGLGMALSVGAVAAQAQQATPDAGHQHGQRGEGRGYGRMLLKGITLTDAQKAQVKSRHEASAPQEKALHEQMRSAFADLRAAKDKNDQGALTAAQSKVDALRKQSMEVREHRVAELRSILTADQRVQLDRNLADAKAHMDQRRGEHGR